VEDTQSIVAFLESGQGILEISRALNPLGVIQADVDLQVVLLNGRAGWKSEKQGAKQER
jgi:hypothetical protein